MKTIFKKITALLAIIVILYASCKSPAEDVEIIVNTDIFKSPTLIQFVNAKKGAAGPQNFTVQITGPDANLVRTSTGGRTYKASSGLLNLVLDRNANPSVASPIRFTVAANIPGFAPVFQDVVISSATKPTHYKVAVTAYANPTLGSASIIATKALSSGTTNTDIQITTPTNAGISLKTDITIPTGTGFLDARGAAIVGSQLESRIVFSGTGTNGSSPVVPGGYISRNVIGTNGQPIAAGVFFRPAGALTIDMFAGDKEVKTFTKTVMVDMEVNASMINPTTNQPIKVGETIPMWSLNNETGQWKAEGNATFATNAAGKLVAKMPINHLSSWMSAFDYNPQPFLIPNPPPLPIFYISCSTMITITKPASSTAQSFTLTGGIFDQEVTFNAGETTQTILTFQINNSNSLLTVQPSIVSLGTVPTYVNNTLTALTACNQVTFNFVAPPAADVINADVYVRFDCTNKKLQTGINAIIKVTPVGGTEDDAQFYNLVNGKASGSMINGVTYEIVASVDGISYKSQFKADKNNFVLPSGFDLTGTAVFDAATNKLKIDGFVRRNCN